MNGENDVPSNYVDPRFNLIELLVSMFFVSSMVEDSATCCKLSFGKGDDPFSGELFNYFRYP